MLGSYLQQTTSADDIFRCIFYLALKGLAAVLVRIGLNKLKYSRMINLVLLHRGSYVSAHVILILLKEMGKEIKWESCRAF